MTYFLQQSLNGVVLGAVLALFAVGFSLVFANMHVFNLAHEAVFAYGAIAAYFMVDNLELPLLVAWPIAVVVSGLLNVAVYFVAVRPLRNRRDRSLAAFVATLGILAALHGVAEIMLGNRVVRLPAGIFPMETWSVFGLRLSTIQLVMLAISAASFTGLWYAVQKSGFGRKLRSVAFDREASEYLGINSEAITAWVFFASGAMAGIAAVPIAIAFNTIHGAMGATYLVIAMAITVLGGFGSIPGTIIAGLLVGVSSSLTSSYVTSSYRDVVVFGALLLVLAIRPTGLFKVGVGIDRV